MIESLFPLMRCIECGKDPLELTVSERNEQEILAGELKCLGCEATYPVEDGIPIMLPKDMREISAEEEDAWFERRKQAEQSFIDEDMETYRTRFLDEAKEEGLNPHMDAIMWEKRLYRETIGQFEKDWEDVPEVGGLKWVRPADAEHDRNEKAIDEMVSKEGGSLKDRIVLNMGPGGDVDLLERMEKAGATLISVDIVKGPLMHLRADPSLTTPRNCVNGDLRGLPFKADAFDVVVSAEVVHHVQPIQPAVSELNRVVKTGKCVYLIEPNGRHLFTYPGRVIPTFVKRWVRIGIRRMFGTGERYMQGSPYERITPIPAFAEAMTKEGMGDIDKMVLTHAPGIFPEPIVKLWEALGKAFPAVFDRVALEFLIVGVKKAR